MDAPRIQSPSAPRARVRWWHWILGATLLIAVACGLLLWRTLTPTRDVRVVRDAIRAAGGIKSDSSFQLSIGTLPLALARLGVHFLPVPAEARVALGTLRGGSVGIYPASSRTRGAKLIETVDRNLNGQGWERVVGVVDGEDVVGVYVPNNLTSHRRIRVAVFVQSREELVVVAARANLAPLLDWIRRQTGEGGRLLPSELLSIR